MPRPEVKIALGPFGGSEENKVVVDGVDLTNGLKSIQLHASHDGETILVVHYACQSVEVEGEMRVRHVCGFGHLMEDSDDEQEMG